MTKIALWIHVCVDDWAAESPIKASNAEVCKEAFSFLSILKTRNKNSLAETEQY